MTIKEYIREINEIEKVQVMLCDGDVIEYTDIKDVSYYDDCDAIAIELDDIIAVYMLSNIISISIKKRRLYDDSFESTEDTIVSILDKTKY